MRYAPGRRAPARYPPDMDGSLRPPGSHPCRAERAGLCAPTGSPTPLTSCSHDE